MWKQLTALSALALLGSAGLAQDKNKSEEGRAPVEQTTTPEDQNRKNPVGASPSSIAEGKRWYATECSMCHGKEGDGKGDVAQDMKLNLRDWRDSNGLQSLTDGELFQIISKGKGQMTGEEARMKPEQTWNLVNYVRSLAKKESPPKPKEEKPKG
jgi:mono/diheme cytochrome c family protein